MTTPLMGARHQEIVERSIRSLAPGSTFVEFGGGHSSKVWADVCIQSGVMFYVVESDPRWASTIVKEIRASEVPTIDLYLVASLNMLHRVIHFLIPRIDLALVDCNAHFAGDCTKVRPWLLDELPSKMSSGSVVLCHDAEHHVHAAQHIDSIYVSKSVERDAFPNSKRWTDMWRGVIA